MNEPVDLFEERARAALMVAGFLNVPLDTLLTQSTEALEALAITAMRDTAHQLRKRVWESTLRLGAA